MEAYLRCMHASELIISASVSPLLLVASLLFLSRGRLGCGLIKKVELEAAVQAKFVAELNQINLPTKLYHTLVAEQDALLAELCYT